MDGTHVAILPGTAYNVMTLMQGMLMASGNDAAGALARGNQSVAVTVQQMNATAAELSASDTVARDPSGLDKADQHSSAYDLALIGRAAMRLPDFRGYVSAVSAFMVLAGVEGRAEPVRPGSVPCPCLPEARTRPASRVGVESLAPGSR